jgi:hypothetical protein
MNLAVGSMYWLVSSVMRAAYRTMKAQTDRQRRFLSLYELHCFIRSVSNPEIAVCSSLFSNPHNNSNMMLV